MLRTTNPTRVEVPHSAGQAMESAPEVAPRGIRRLHGEAWGIPVLITDATFALIGALGMWGVLNLFDRIAFGLAVSNAG